MNLKAIFRLDESISNIYPQYPIYCLVYDGNRGGCLYWNSLFLCSKEQGIHIKYCYFVQMKKIGRIAW